jgi:hypothetical protein
MARFREQHPLVEITLLHMNNRAQVEAVLNGSIMLGIGYYSYLLKKKTNRSSYPLDCYFVRVLASSARKIGVYQREQFQS